MKAQRYSGALGGTLLTDLRLALRMLRHSRSYFIFASVTFALAIGAVTVVYSVVDAVLLRDTAYADRSRTVLIEGSMRSSSGIHENWSAVSAAAFDVIARRSDVFDQVAAKRKSIFTVTGVAQPDQIFGFLVTGNYFSFLSGRVQMGRTLSSSDAKPGAASVAVLSYAAWQHLLAGERDVIGSRAVIDGKPYAVIGVLRRDFEIPDERPQIWTVLPKETHDNVDVIARLRLGLSAAQAQAALKTMRVAEDPAEQFRLSPARKVTDTKVRGTLLLALGLVGALLLLGCANVTALSLARRAGRERQTAIQLAAGAGRTHLLRQVFAEVLLISTTGLALGSALSYVLIGALREQLQGVPSALAASGSIAWNGRVVALGFALTLLAALAASLLPAWFSLNVDMTTAMRTASSPIAGRRRASRSLTVLIAVEAALATTLLATSGLFLHSLVRLLNDDHGLHPDHVLTMHLPYGSFGHSLPDGPEGATRQIERYRHVLGGLADLSGIQAAALTSTLPLSHVSVTTLLQTPGMHGTLAEQTIGLPTQAVTADYFRVLGIPVVSGRSFERSDEGGDVQSVMVNQAFALKYFGKRDAIGQLLYQPRDPKGVVLSSRIVGIVKNSAYLDFDEQAEPMLYLPFSKHLLTPFLTGLLIRSSVDPKAIAALAARRIHNLEPGLVVVQERTMEALVAENIWLPRLSALLFTWFSLLALALASAGILGVTAYRSALRRREFGIRLALGAQRGRLWTSLTAHSQKPVLAGCLLGLVLATLLGRVLSALIYKAESFDLLSFAGSGTLLLAVAVVAAAVPAAIVLRTDPAAILRSE